jgi:predicted anti-sigma-YlaC factor YlaD
MKCSYAQKHFDLLYVNGPAVDTRLKEHLRACPKCAKAYEQWVCLARIIESVPAAPQAPPGLAQRVKERIHAAHEKKSVLFAIPAFRPNVAFVIPALLAAAGVIAFLAILAGSHSPATKAGNQAASLMSHSFSVALTSAHRVAIAGDFNGWNPSSDTLSAAGDGLWTITLRLSRGNYQYQYIIDNKMWVTDPDNPVKIDDGFGGYNSGMEL